MYFLVKLQPQIKSKTICITLDLQNMHLKHKYSFKYESKRNSTELSNSIWSKKEEKINVDLEWSILNKAKPYSPGSKKLHVMSYREISHHFLYKESAE